MNIYTDILIQLNKDVSLSAKYNALMKLYYKTEDCVLKNYIRQYADVLQEAEVYRKRKLPSHTHQVLLEGNRFKVELESYCTEIKMSKKPEWQVLAERYGWTPPVK